MPVLDEFITTDKDSWFRYLLVTPKAKSLGAYVRGAGFASVLPRSPYPPNGHSNGHASVMAGRTLPCYQFVYITHGSGVFSSQTHQNEPVGAGDMIMVFPQVWHRYAPLPDTGWREYWIEFDGDYVRRLMTQTGFTPDSPVQYLGIHDSILDLFLKALAWLKNEPPEYPLLLGSLATQMIAQALSTAKWQSQNGQSDAAIIREARRWLIHDPGSAENLSDLASQLNVSYSTFRHRFKAETGISPRQFALEARIRKASNLLARTEAAPHAIAELCGMESHYFSKWFKKKIGLTPTAYRQRHRQPMN
ncbi:MAG TPA: AraC family transcriptional regulator [Verrucomicrobiae bacterium]|jgi:AraC-like DNA-binding protein